MVSPYRSPSNLLHRRKHKVAHETKRKSPLALACLTSLHTLQQTLQVSIAHANSKSLVHSRVLHKSLCAHALKGLALNETTAQSRDCAVATKGNH